MYSRARTWLKTHPKWRWWIVWTWMAIFTVVVGVGVRGNRQLGHEGREAHDALCALRVNLSSRIDRSVTFLKNHPHGFDSISGDEIRIGIKNDRTALRALSVVKC